MNIHHIAKNEIYRVTQPSRYVEAVDGDFRVALCGPKTREATLRHRHDAPYTVAFALSLESVDTGTPLRQRLVRQLILRVIVLISDPLTAGHGPVTGPPWTKA